MSLWSEVLARVERKEQTEMQVIQVKQQSPLLATPSPTHGECLECDELIRLGLPLHLAWSTGGGVLCHSHLSEGIFLGARKFSIDTS